MERDTQPAHSRLKAGGLLEALGDSVCEANLYRFCQLLEQALPGNPPLGSSHRLADDPVRFRPHPGMGFAPGELKGIEVDAHAPAAPVTVRTRLLGLYGVDAPLPSAYLDDIAQRREGHEAIEAFLDIFNHRFMTQFYRIWRKYAYPASFEAGGADSTSQCLLGLIGLGIPGTAQQIATPVSRFLGLLGVMRLPTRTAEGITALVRLLAPSTAVRVRAHWPRRIVLAQPARLSRQWPVRLGQGTPLGALGTDVNSQVGLLLATSDLDEGRAWLPGNRLHADLLVLLRVYLGWRCDACLHLCLPLACLPAAVLGRADLHVGMTAVLGLGGAWQPPPDARIRIVLGRYQGLTLAQPTDRSIDHVRYVF